MGFRQLGGSGLKVPVLSLGTGTFGGGGELFKAWGSTDVAEASRLIDVCLDAGLNLFDSADIYSHGMAEEILGQALKGRRDRVLISTKGTFRFGQGSNDDVTARLSAASPSLKWPRSPHSSRRSAVNPSTKASAKENTGWNHSSTCREVEAEGTAEGRAYGLAEAQSRTLARLLKSQAKQLFGELGPGPRGTLNGLAQAFACDPLLDLGERLLTAPSWSEWLAGVVVPPPAPGLPDWTRDQEIDFEPSGPSIDLHVKVGLKAGGEAIIHLRFQKWYQPDLDRHLFEETRKLERRMKKEVMVCVFLMWPPAEGPGMTGKYEERDAEGKVRRTFTYTIKRAWDLTPEEVTQTPGTMLLAPLCKGARERMPEVVQMVKQGIERNAVEPEKQDAIWGAVYWSMGLICDLEECHRALGDLLPMLKQSRYYLSAKGECYREAYSAALNEGSLLAARALVLRQATKRFGPQEGAADTLAAITSMEELEGLTERVLTAADWPSLLEKPQ